MRYETLVSKRWTGGALAALIALACIGGPAWGIEPKQPTPLGEKAFFIPELYISSSQLPIQGVLKELPNNQAWQDYMSAVVATGRQAPAAYVDPRSGAAAGIVESVPLVPGTGVGNTLTLDDVSARIGRAVSRVDATIVADAVLSHVLSREAVLAVDAAQLGPVRAVQVSPTLWQARIPQVYQGIPVRHGHMVASISHGNLVVMGTEAWGNVEGLSTKPEIGSGDAMAAGFSYAGGASEADRLVHHPALEIVPVAPRRFQRGEGFDGPLGRGYGHRLVWTFAFQRPPSREVWEVMVDAHSGEVIAFEDLNQYASEKISGGVYPITSTEICPTPGTCGEMQPDWPMPFADTGQPSPNNLTNSGGVFFHTGGTATTTLTGQYVDIVDNCGAVSESNAGSIDMGGANGDHDCAAAGSAGNTAASRTAFYELNKQIEQGRGWLPGNSWLQSQLTSNVNINNTCNAFWSVTFQTVNFYRSGGGCRNTGELAGVFDHEWGHGLDDNDAGGALSNSSEAYADIAGIYRLQDSCVGHGFYEAIDDGCGMTSDGTGFNSNENQVGGFHCDLDCSGVRDADWARHNPATPDTALGFVCNECSTSSGPCGRQVHCAAAPSRQAAWDFVTRDLPAAGHDSQTSFMIGNKIFYQGSGNIGTWHSCTCGVSSDGCGATNAYIQWLAADDDDGDLGNGTPHIEELFAAFDRHGIACSTPTPVNSGCATGPTGAATLGATPGNNQIDLSWGPVTGAGEYWVMRTEGHAGCDFGKALIATVTGTSYTDTEVANGRDYSYNIVAADAANDACYGPVSNCVTVQPVGQPDFGVSCSPASHSIQQGADAQSTCTVSAEFGYTGDVDLSCSGQPAGINCGFAPSTVGAPGSSTLTITVDLAQATGLYDFDVVGFDGTLTRTSAMTVNVTPEGQNGPQVAVFDPSYQAPTCLIPGSECDTVGGVDSRDSLSPAEPNQPNTISDSCADGTLGTYHSDESNDRIVVKTLDGFDFAEGATVQIDATVYAWSTGSSDTVDFFYAADASSPSWTLIGSQVPPTGGLQTLSTQYTLPTGGLQAVRVQFRYTSTNAPCSTGSYNDRDDLVFAVNPAAECTVDADCDDGEYCNGAETCNAGSCEAGTPPVCDDGVACTVDTCNEVTDSCDVTPDDGFCDNGEYCDGAETCDAIDDCQPGTAPDCDDGVGCTVDACNEGTDSCDNTPDDGACDNGLYCDGAEACDAVSDCQPGTAPSCDDGVGCTVDGCNEATDSCDNTPNDALCDNGTFCDGAETCDAVSDCQPGTDPCPGQSCDEAGDLCVECLVDADCSDGAFCNGAEVCNAGVCEAGTPPSCDNGEFCDGTETCNETTDSCDPGTPPVCDDGAFCNGAETCNEATDSCDPGTPPACDDGVFCNGAESCDEGLDSCVGGAPPTCNDGVGCTDDGCNLATDSCQNIANDANCDNGEFCDGAETCDAVLDCQPGSDPCPGQSCNESTDVCEPTGPGARLEAGTVTVDAVPVTVDLSNTYASPVVVTTMRYSNSIVPTVTRVSNVTATSFDLRLQNPSGGAVAAETVSYLVVEEGSWNIDGFQIEAQKYTSTVTDENNSWVGEAQTYLGSYTNPVVLGQVMSENDSLWSVFWDRGVSRAEPPSSASLFTGKTVGEDPVVTRADETVGFVVFEAGHGTIGGVEFEAALGADSVRGVGNLPPYLYSFATPFATAPTVALASMAAVDGADGAWAQTHGPTVASTTTLFLSVDEDTVGDAERSHTREQVGYAVFAGPVVYPAGPECSIDADCADGLYCNGDEVCSGGFCQAGTPPVCDDGEFCNGAETCNEATDSCDAGTPPACDDGLYCNGAETCNEATDGCDAGAPVICEDGLFCNGAEICNETTDSCDAGTDPCAGGSCDEATDTCAGVAVMEWGSVSAGAAPVTVNLGNSYASPVIVATVQYENNTVPVVTRIDNVTANSFDLRLQNAGAGAAVADDVSYLVVEEGVHTVDGVAIEAQLYTSTVTDHDASWIGEAQSYGQSYTSPVVLGQVMTSNDLDWSVFWNYGPSRADPPTASSLNTGKTVCEDPATVRADETLGIIVIEAGHGTLGGVEYEAALGADSVRGVGNLPPYPYTFASPFASPPTVGMATMAAVDGANGGWAQVHGPTMATTSTLYLSIDEDAVADTERSHTREQVGYLVFAGPGSAD